MIRRLKQTIAHIDVLLLVGIFKKTEPPRESGATREEG